MKFTLEISYNNAAFEEYGMNNELTRILREVARKVERGIIDDDYHVIRDINGDWIATVDIVTEPETAA